MKYINIIGGLVLWLVCILILVDPTGFIASKPLAIIMVIYVVAGFLWYVGSILIGKAVDQQSE